MFEEDEEASDGNVLPQSVGRERARAPNANAARGKTSDYVNAARIQHALCVVVNFEAHVERAANDLICRRFENTAFSVGARINTEHMSTRRHLPARATQRIGDH